MRFCVLAVACFSSKQRPSNSQGCYAGFDHCYAFPGSGFRPWRASRLSRASCPSRPPAFLPFAGSLYSQALPLASVLSPLRGLPVLRGLPALRRPPALDRLRGLSSLFRAACSEILWSLSSGLLLVLKFSIHSFSSGLLLVLNSLVCFEQFVQFFSTSLVPFERFARCSQILQSLPSGLLHFMSLSSGLLLCLKTSSFSNGLLLVVKLQIL